MAETSVPKRISLNYMVEICLVGLVLSCCVLFVFFNKKKRKQRHGKLS